jgi:hypothetical protein
MITINLKTAVVIPTLENDRATLPDDIGNLRALLHYIGLKIKFDIIDSISGNLHDDFEIALNGTDVWFLPGRLDTPLKENDTLEIIIVGLGGG